MITSDKAFMYAIQSFPKWMTIRKDPRESISGKYLLSLIQEQDNINKELQAFIKDFFLASYIGREDTILDYAYVAQVGNIDLTLTDIDLKVKVTDNPRYFLNNRNTSCLYQDGKVILDISIVPDDLMFRYSYKDHQYASKLVKVHIWNIFDEFAMMSSLERYDNETNKQLMQRCFMSFRNKTNSTEEGIKNTIINTLTNYVPLSLSEINIDVLNKDNIYSKDEEYDNLYERLAQFNKDFFKNKIWDMCIWEHNFKEMDFVPNEWDVDLDYYQIGTGQNNDLITKLSDSKNNTTDLQITGYKQSQVVINEYIHKHNITKEIPLKLTKYKNELKSKTIDYRIRASEAIKINPDEITLNTGIKILNGENSIYLDNCINTVPDSLTKYDPVKALEDGIYKLKFLPKNDYCDMSIFKAQIQDEDLKIHNLLKENNTFKFNNGVLQNKDVLFHMTQTYQALTFKNIINKKNQLTIGTESSSGEFTIDITGMGGKPLIIKSNCKEVNYTSDREFVKTHGFILKEDNILTSSEDNSSIFIDIECSSFSFDFLNAENPTLQGSCSVLITIDDEIDDVSGLWTSGKKYSKQFNKLCNVHVEIQKAGMYPISIKDIMASRYRITTELAYGNLIHTPFNTILPNYDKPNTLTVKIESFSSYAPMIEYVHIGPSVKHASYEIDNINIDKTKKLSIDTNCRVELYKDNQLISNDFTTYCTYTNNTDKDIDVEIALSQNLTIINSSKPLIKTDKMHGIFKDTARTIYIMTIKPDESLVYIDIIGSGILNRGQYSLTNLLQLEKEDNVYVTSNSKGFIVVSKNKKERLQIISSNNYFHTTTDYYEFINLPKNITGLFVSDKINNICNKTNIFNGKFQEVYLTLKDSKEYIAYNSETTFIPEVNNINMVNTFYPLLDMSKLMYYEIDSSQLNANIEFIKQYNTTTEYSNWSLGNKKLRLTCAFDFSNANEYGVEINQIKEIFSVSNTIELDDSYIINNQVEEIARFIIEPPKDMMINYEEETVTEDDILIQKDMFNKLYYSNITNIHAVKINNQIIASNKYDLNNMAGIVFWKDNSLVGQKFSIMYSYNKPISLSYKSLDSLYEIVEYSTDAYIPINKNPIIIKDSKDGDKNIINFNQEIPDKIIVKCNNPSFGAVVSNKNEITTKLININNNIMVKTGYYYDNIGNEYYLFENIYYDPIDKYDSIELHYVKKHVDFLEFMQKSTNHVLDSSLHTYSRKEKLCHVNFKNKKVPGISALNSISACDSYQKWTSFDMNISINDKQFNSPCLEFKANSQNSYALLEINPNNKQILTVLASSQLKLSIIQEIKLKEDRMYSNVFTQPYADLIQYKDTNIYYYDFKKCDINYKYYLFVQGSGLLDDILLISDKDKIESGHIKNLDLLFKDIIETTYKSYEHHLIFDCNYNKLKQLEFTQDGILQTGSNVDWGVTKIYDVYEDLNKCILDNVILRDEAYYSIPNKTGKITTPAILLNNKQSIKDLYVVINNVTINKFANFNIRILTANNPTNTFTEISYNTKTNLLDLPISALFNYIKIEIEVPPDKIINSICVYVRYSESKYDTPKITNYNNGYLISKIYDTTYEADFKPYKLIPGSKLHDNINDLQNIKLYMRGYKKDNQKEEWTDWHRIYIAYDYSLTIENNHVFNQYRFFQFKIELNNVNVKLNIKEIILKVVH